MLHPLVAKLLLLPALWYPPGQSRPETPEQYEQRLGTIAQAADAAAKQVPWEWGERAMRLAVLSHFYGESRFELAVHRGLPGRYGSDKGRSKCLGQIHVTTVAPKVWRSLGGTSLAATTRCAVQTALLLRAHQRRCAGSALSRGSLGLAFQAMSGSRRCRAPNNAARDKVRWFWRLL